MQSPPALGHRGPLRDGEKILLVDAKDRRYLLRLQQGGQFHTHAGIVAHDDLIGSHEGASVVGTTGRRFLVLRPTFADVVLKMPRGAQVIYPKDLGAIVMAADIAPGRRVLEAGVGSGALSMAMLRAGAEVVGYELRPDFAERAVANVGTWVGVDRYRVELRDVYEGIDDGPWDRVVLDLPEPWRVVPHAATALAPGGLVLAYLPTINQTAQLRRALDNGPFALAETFEVLRRTWHVEARSVRPDHRMVAHTGFLTTARLVVDPDGGSTANPVVDGAIGLTDGDVTRSADARLADLSGGPGAGSAGSRETDPFEGQG